MQPAWAELNPPSIGVTGTTCPFHFDSSGKLLMIENRYDKTLSPALLRVSVGAEDPKDLVEDVRQALEKLA